MRFSIIIPAYNSYRYISKALESVKNQSFTDYELLVICDSCTDSTQKKAQYFGAKTVKVDFHKEGLTKNVGIDLAQGEYILFIDDDDWLLHEFVLEQIDEKLRQENDPDILCFSFIFKGIGYAPPIRKSCNEHWIATWNKAWKRDAIGDTRFPDIFSTSDRPFNDTMLKEKNLRIVDWDMPMYYYNYLREGSISQQSGRSIRLTRECL